MFSFAAVLRTVRTFLYCCPSTFSFVKSGRASPFLVIVSPCAVLSAVESQLFPTQNRLEISAHQNCMYFGVVARWYSLGDEFSRCDHNNCRLRNFIRHVNLISDQTTQFLGLAKFYYNERMKDSGCTWRT